MNHTHQNKRVCIEQGWGVHFREVVRAETAVLVRELSGQKEERK
jgi:hypothetical protein